MAENTTKKTCVLIGTCITFGVAFMLRSSEEFLNEYDFIKFETNSDTKIVENLGISDELLARADVIIYHPPGWADWGNEEGYVNLVQRFPENAEKISIPYPIFPVLWPFHCHDSRNEQVNGQIFPDGGVINYPYGDAIVVGALKKGIDPAEILSYCMSVDYAEMIDLQALLNTSMNIQIQKEADTDVKMLDFVQNNFTNRRVFQTMNHVGNETLLHMVNQILARLGLAKLPRTLLDRIDELVRPQSPIHPSVIRHFDLRYVDADTRYLVDRYRYLTYEEYLWNYIKFI